MNKQENISTWLKQCPSLANLYNISAEQQDGANIIFPSGSSSKKSINERIDALGCYEAEIKPRPSVYEDYQINCYKQMINNANALNIMKYEEAEEVIKWIEAQDDIQNFPNIDEDVISVEANPFIPQIRGVDPDKNEICYYVTLRITYVNRGQGRCVECQT